MHKGFSLVEVIVGTAVFLLVSFALYNAMTSLIHLATAGQERTLAVQLAAEQFEIIRNVPYVSVGLTNGIPLGIFPQVQTVVRGGVTFNIVLTIRNINLSTSTVQASDKLIEVAVSCPLCHDFQTITLTGQASPPNLQSASNGGALVVHVFDANGQPVPDATVNVVSLATSTVQNTDVTDNNGTLNIIGIPAGVNTYRITVTKAGYSTDRTYAVGTSSNPNPNNPDATILDQQVTNVSLSIDRLSSLSFSSVSPTCVPVANIPFSIAGSKLIGVGVVKYPLVNKTTDGSGVLTLSDMEWDTYTITPTNFALYDVAGINPFSPLILNPNNSQNVQFVVVPANPNSLMVSVEDGSTKLPISGATVELSGPNGYDQTKITGQGYLQQANWSSGPVQDGIYIDPNAYATDNGNIDTNTATSSGNITLHWWDGSGYQTNTTGTLESSTFDTGTTSNFYIFNWAPVNQPQLAGTSSVLFQLATAMNPGGPWNYVGPDGTSDTYFNVSGGSINSSQNGNEYVRYRAYLNTSTATVTPMVSNVSFSYTSRCIPPGQVLFQGLVAGNYTLTISANGYALYSGNVGIDGNWQQSTVFMGP